MTQHPLDRSTLNLDKDFDRLVEENLGAYIYILKYPAPNNRPFYIGKGGGNGRGNKRIIDHFTEARKALKNGSGDQKTKTIHNIWSEGKEVDWVIYKCEEVTNVSDVAEIVESALIQYSTLFLSSQLTNKNRGKADSFLTREQVLGLASKKVTFEHFQSQYIKRPIMLFPIERGFNKTNNYTEALIRSWKISESNRNLSNAVAIGLIDSISYAALSIQEWRVCDQDTKRYEILPSSEQHEILKHKNFGQILAPVLNYWKYGCGGGGIIFEVQEDRNVVFIRGKNKKAETIKL